MDAVGAGGSGGCGGRGGNSRGSGSGEGGTEEEDEEESESEGEGEGEGGGGEEEEGGGGGQMPEVPSVDRGQVIEVYWERPRRWYTATVKDIVEDVGRRWAVLVEYRHGTGDKAYHFMDGGRDCVKWREAQP